MKYLGINLTKEVQNSYTKKYKMLLKRIKDLNKWKDTPWSWSRPPNVVKMTLLPNKMLIQCCNFSQNSTGLFFFFFFCKNVKTDCKIHMDDELRLGQMGQCMVTFTDNRWEIVTKGYESKGCVVCSLMKAALNITQNKKEKTCKEWSNRHGSVRNPADPLSRATGENYKSTTLWSL